MTCRITVHRERILQKQWRPRLHWGYSGRFSNKSREPTSPNPSRRAWCQHAQLDNTEENGLRNRTRECHNPATVPNFSCGSRRGGGQSEYLGLQRYGWRGQLVQQVQDRPAGRTKGRGHGRDWERRRRASRSQSCLPTETRRSPPARARVPRSLRWAPYPAVGRMIGHISPTGHCVAFVVLYQVHDQAAYNVTQVLPVSPRYGKGEKRRGWWRSANRLLAVHWVDTPTKPIPRRPHPRDTIPTPCWGPILYTFTRLLAQPDARSNVHLRKYIYRTRENSGVPVPCRAADEHEHEREQTRIICVYPRISRPQIGAVRSSYGCLFDWLSSICA